MRRPTAPRARSPNGGVLAFCPRMRAVAASVASHGMLAPGDSEAMRQAFRIRTHVLYWCNARSCLRSAIRDDQHLPAHPTLRRRSQPSLRWPLRRWRGPFGLSRLWCREALGTATPCAIALRSSPVGAPPCATVCRYRFPPSRLTAIFRRAPAGNLTSPRILPVRWT